MQRRQIVRTQKSQHQTFEYLQRKRKWKYNSQRLFHRVFSFLLLVVQLHITYRRWNVRSGGDYVDHHRHNVCNSWNTPQVHVFHKKSQGLFHLLHVQAFDIDVTVFLFLSQKVTKIHASFRNDVWLSIKTQQNTCLEKIRHNQFLALSIQWTNMSTFSASVLLHRTSFKWVFVVLERNFGGFDQVLHWTWSVHGVCVSCLCIATLSSSQQRSRCPEFE